MGAVKRVYGADRGLYLSSRSEPAGGVGERLRGSHRGVRLGGEVGEVISNRIEMGAVNRVYGADRGLYLSSRSEPAGGAGERLRGSHRGVRLGGEVGEVIS